MRGGWVYIVTNRPNGTLYVGVTSDLARRLWEHREGVADRFAKKYGLNASFALSAMATSKALSSANTS